MEDDLFAHVVSIRATRPNNRPLRGQSGSEYDRNRRVNTAANVSAGVCVAPVILALLVLLAIELQKQSLERTRRLRARAQSESANTSNASSSRDAHSTAEGAGPTGASSLSLPSRDALAFPAEAVLAGVLFNRRRFFFGRSAGSRQGPCVVAAPQPRCLMVWLGMPARFEDDFEYLAHSEGVTFTWEAHQAGEPWPSNAVQLSADTSPGGRDDHWPRVEEFFYGRSAGYSHSSLLAGVVRVSESPKLIVIDNHRVRLFPRYELLVRNNPGYPVERWHQCQDRCNTTEGAVYGGLEGGSPTLVGRAYYDGSFSPCKVVSVGCVLPGGQVALIFEFLVESRGVIFEWVNGSNNSSSSSKPLTESTSADAAPVVVGDALVGRSQPLPPDGRLLLGAILRPSNGSTRLHACDAREPLPAPLDHFQVLVKRRSSGAQLLL